MTEHPTKILQIWNDYTSVNKITPAHISYIFPIRAWRVSENPLFPVRALDENFKQEWAGQKNFGILVTTAEDIGKALDFKPAFLYLPGEICRQSDILIAAAATRLPLYIERGTFLAPPDVLRMLVKIKDADVNLVECGSSFGYQNTVLDPRVFAFLTATKRKFGLNLSSLLEPQEHHYAHRSQWLSNDDFIPLFTKCGKNFGCSFFVMERDSFSISEEAQ